MLPDLLEVRERRGVLLHDGAHASQRRSLELLASVERVAVLEELDVILGDLVDDVLGGIELPERELVVVLVVQNVEEVAVEGVDIVKLREGVQDVAELVVKSLLGVLDFSLRKKRERERELGLVAHEGEGEAGGRRTVRKEGRVKAGKGLRPGGQVRTM